MTRVSRVNKDSKEPRARRDHRAKLVTAVPLARSVRQAVPATVDRTVLLAPRAQSGLRDNRAHRASRVSRVPLDSRVLPGGLASREMPAVLGSLEQLESRVSLEVSVNLVRWEPLELRGRRDLRVQLAPQDRRARLETLGRSGLRETPDHLDLRESRGQLGQPEALDSLD